MTIKLYKTASDPRTVDKVLTDELVVTGVPRDPLDILNPVIEVQGNSTDHLLAGYNYMVIEEYNRSYFLELTNDSYDLNTVRGRVDVLSSAKTYLRAKSATLTRNERQYSAYLNDSEFNAYAYRNIVTKKFPSGITGDSIILMTVG